MKSSRLVNLTIFIICWHIILAPIFATSQIFQFDFDIAGDKKTRVIRVLSEQETPYIDLRILITPPQHAIQSTQLLLRHILHNNHLEQQLTIKGVLIQYNQNDQWPYINLKIPNDNDIIKDSIKLVAEALSNPPKLNTPSPSEAPSMRKLAQKHYNDSAYGSISLESQVEINQFYQQYFNANYTTIMLVGSISESMASWTIHQLDQVLSKHIAHTQSLQPSLSRVQKNFKHYITIENWADHFVFIKKNMNNSTELMSWLFIYPYLSNLGATTSKTNHWPQIPSISYEYFFSGKSADKSLADALLLTEPSFPVWERSTFEQRKDSIKQSLPDQLTENHTAILDALSFIVAHNLSLDYFDHLLQQIQNIDYETITQSITELLNPKSFSYVMLGPNHD